MAVSLGKKWELIFKEQWQKCFPNTFFYRVPDQVSGYKTTSQNPCDFFAFAGGYFWMLECKETTEGTLNFSKIPQLSRLATYTDMDHVAPYIIIWYSEKDKVVACPVKDALKMQTEGKKSISLKSLEDKAYNMIDLPAIKKRVFMDVDYKALLAAQEQNESRHQ